MTAPSPAKPDIKPPKGAKRRATQQRIIDAFERILVRDGVGGIGINAIMAEAGIQKTLIYRYFGGLEGLAEAWMEQADLAPSVEDIAGMPLEDFRGLDAPTRLATIHINYARLLRDRPAACRILAEDLRHGSDLPKVLEKARLLLGKSHEELLMSDPELMQPKYLSAIFVLQAAANYLALRAQASPVYNGIPLDSEEGWGQVMDMLRAVAAAADG